MTDLITITDPKELDLYGWGTYNGAPRTEYPRAVTAHRKLWDLWRMQHLAATVEQRDAQRQLESQNDPEYKKFLHQHDNDVG